MHRKKINYPLSGKNLDNTGASDIIKAQTISYETKMEGNMKLSEAQLSLLQQTGIFYAVPLSTIKKIAASPDCEVKSYKKGQLIYSTTEFSRSLGVVLSGSLRVTKGNAGGHAMIMSTLTPPSLFGAAALFNDEAEYATDISALSDAEIVFFAQRLVQRMMRFEPQIAENYIKYLSERILFLNRKLYLLSSGTAEQRLASFLLDNLPLGQAAELPMPLSKLSLALNVSRASLYRAFDALTESGAVVKEGRKVCINDAERLKKNMR